MSKDSSGNVVRSSDQTFATLPVTTVYVPPLVVPSPPVNYIPSIYVSPPTARSFTNTNTISKPTHIERNLSIGDTGTDVKLLQEILNILGYAVTVMGKETNTFDKITQKALMSYQFDKGGLESTGILDNVTLVLINKDIVKINQEQSNYFNATSSSQAKNFLIFFIERVINGFLKVVEKVKSII
jgi:peptidoglycan hydrolase-like protein with peptidoglycan-binding domain